MGPQYEQPWVKGQRSTLTFEKLIYTIVSLVLTYQERIITLALIVFKKSTFKKQFPFKCKFDLDVK